MPEVDYLGRLEDKFSINDVGSTLLDNLAKGLYEPGEVLREYIQNAVDAHRMWKNTTGTEPEGSIQIEVQGDKISFLDCGIGMDDAEIRKVKAIAVSKKPEEEIALTGHKGVGIWAGLSYFKTLIVKSKKKESSVMYQLTIDFQNIVEAINMNRNIGDALNPNYRIDMYREDPEIHYSIVTLQGPTRAREIFLDIDKIKEAISTICPCRIDPTFVYNGEVNHWYQQNELEQFDIIVDGKPVYRSYPSNLMNFTSEVITINDSVSAVCWFAVNQRSRKLDTIDGQMVGLRVIQHGFTIGVQNLYSDENIQGFDALQVGSTLDWYAGEIHIKLKDLRPNLQRNKFEESELARIFIKRLREWYKSIEIRTRLLSTERNFIKDYNEIDEKITEITRNIANISLEQKNCLNNTLERITKDENKYERNKRKANAGYEIKALKLTATRRRKIINDIKGLLRRIELATSQTQQEHNNQPHTNNECDHQGDTVHPNNSSSGNPDNGHAPNEGNRPQNGSPNGSNPQDENTDSSDEDTDENYSDRNILVSVVMGLLDEVLNEELVDDLLKKEKIISRLNKRLKEVISGVQ